MVPWINRQSLSEIRFTRVNGDARSKRHEVEQDGTPLDLIRTTAQDYLATISRSSISNTNVAPGLIKGGRPLSR
jgi:hypothetical protein